MTDFHPEVAATQLPLAHAEVLHAPARAGYVVIVDEDWRGEPVPVAELPRYLVVHAKTGRENVYISQSRFRWRRRRVVDVVTVNALWTDLDYHRRHPEWSIDDAVYALLLACDTDHLPHPSYVLATGRGACAVWLTDVLPARALPRWNRAQAALWEHFRGFGADAAARDAARVLRLAGSVNPKPVPAVAVRCVYPQIGEPVVYSFDALCRLLLPLERRACAPRPGGAVGAAAVSRPAARLLFDVGAGSAAQLWADRLGDLQIIRELRWFGGLPPGHVDLWLFLCACGLAWTVPPPALRREICELARRAGAAWTQHAVMTDMGAVIRRAEAAARGETIRWEGVDLDPRYRLANGTIIDRLGITLEEQRALRTIFGPEERRRRYKQHQAERGRRSGESRRERTRERDAAIIEMRLEGWSQREIARSVGVSRDVVRWVLGRAGGVGGEP